MALYKYCIIIIIIISMVTRRLDSKDVQFGYIRKWLAYSNITRLGPYEPSVWH